MGIVAAAIVIVVSFLLGSIPWGLVISKVFFHKDLRNEGSGNIGTTNAIRALGKAGGYMVFVLDFAKGILSGVIAGALCSALLPEGGFAAGYEPSYYTMLALAFFFCIVGHIFTPWLGFKGGKGIACAVGCMFITFGPLVAVLELALFAILVVSTKYVSVGSIAAAAACPFFALWTFWGHWPAVILCSMAALIVVWAHRGNIERLRAGTESRIGDKKKAK